MDIQELKKNGSEELISRAEKLGIENPSTLRKQEIIFSILKKLAENNEKITCVSSDKPLPYRLRINQSCDCSHESYGFCDFRNTSYRRSYR